jgi:hypothetical protein
MDTVRPGTHRACCGSKQQLRYGVSARVRHDKQGHADRDRLLFRNNECDVSPIDAPHEYPSTKSRAQATSAGSVKKSRSENGVYFCSPVPAARPLTFRVLVHVLATVHPRDDGRPRPNRVTETGGAYVVCWFILQAMLMRAKPARAPLVVGDNLAEQRSHSTGRHSLEPGTPRYQSGGLLLLKPLRRQPIRQQKCGFEPGQDEAATDRQGHVFRALGFQSCMDFRHVSSVRRRAKPS